MEKKPSLSTESAAPAAAAANPGSAATPAPARRCLVTVGATASFRPLLAAALSAAFLDVLAALGFGELVVQTGAADEAWAVDRCRALAAASPPPPSWPAIQTLAYTTDLAGLMLPCRGGTRPRKNTKTVRPPGVVVAHAGAGTILDAARLDVPLVVVSNPALLHDHQAELAEAVAAAGWAVRGVLDAARSDQWLADAVRQAVARADAEAEARRARLEKKEDKDDNDNNDDNVYHEPPFPTAESERCGLFDWAAVYAGAGRDDEALLRME